jgi:hypothetical protein
VIRAVPRRFGRSLLPVSPTIWRPDDLQWSSYAEFADKESSRWIRHLSRLVFHKASGRRGATHQEFCGMSITSVLSQLNNPYRALQVTQNSPASSPANPTPGIGSPGTDADGDNDGTKSPASQLNASLGKILDSYA